MIPFISCNKASKYLGDNKYSICRQEKLMSAQPQIGTHTPPLSSLSPLGKKTVPLKRSVKYYFFTGF